VSLDRIEQIFAPAGFLSEQVKNYELRKEQQEMSSAVMHAFENNQILLAEAATGVGKSWAYLAPALLWAADKKGSTIISTHTIALQEQLLHKDIPFLLDTLGLDLQATLVKGMGNYFCFRKYEEALQEESLFSEEEKKGMDKLKIFAQNAKEGSFSELSVPLSGDIWEKVAAERSSCTHVECPYFKECFFFKARKSVADAHIIIVNHAFLMADMALRLRPDFDEEKSLLPKCSKIVIDEAHHLEEIALESFSIRTDRLDLIRYLGRIYSDHAPLRSRIGLLKTDLILRRVSLSPMIANALDIDIPAQKRTLSTALDNLLNELERFCSEELVSENGASPQEKRWRLTENCFSHLLWKEKIEKLCETALEEHKRLIITLGFVVQELQRTLSEKNLELLASHFTALGIWQEVFSEKISQLSRFIFSPMEEKRVRWVESSFHKMKNLMLVDATLSVADSLHKHLFSQKDTAILCSATLTSNQNFSFLKQQIGLSQKDFETKTEEKIYHSPFDFEKNARFLIPSDISFPHEYSFLEETSQMIQKILEASQGGCFVLFTSYDMLQKCYDKVLSSPKAPPLFYLKQGEESKKTLIEKFRKNKDSVLFATSSFWEGVDIAGNALRCVIITKLPFKVPSDPLFQAMSELYTKEGKDPFMDYSLPQACLQFKQGFGRLIRTKSDKGCVICLDKRIMAKGYGKAFLRSLPNCPTSYKKGKDLLEEMRAFYQQHS
jgi:ATP-dependent DNA helicase DinG